MRDDLPERLRRSIRDIPDFPQPGVLFRDVTTLLLDPGLVAEAIDALWETFDRRGITHVVAVEARGFILGMGIAMRCKLPLVLMRKPGKLPAERLSEEYELEYGKGRLEVHADALRPGDRVLIVDDVLATGGTAAAAGRLVRRCGAELVGYAFLAELGFLEGRARLEGCHVLSLLRYD
ncbi:MAG: adenine phosphoribosyltransferase [Candidatus Eisenbacteria bacterium]|nr:adenine phosphoribosyltransferase [Candidatus Eisenbacteria bacterium]